MDFDDKVRKAWESFRRKSPSKETAKKELKDVMEGKKAEKTAEKKDSVENNEERSERSTGEESIDDRLQGSEGFERSKIPEEDRFALRTAAPKRQMGGDMGRFISDDEETVKPYDTKDRAYSKDEDVQRDKDDRKYTTIEDSVSTLRIESPIVVQNKTLFDKPNLGVSAMRDAEMPSIKKEVEDRLYDSFAKPNYDLKEHVKREDARKYSSVKAQKGA